MPRQTRYRVSASTGGWRSLPWPFGLFEISETTLTVGSWHWSWWLAGRVIRREEIESVTAVTRTGVPTICIATDDEQIVKVYLTTSRKRAVGELVRVGYLAA